MWHKKKSYYPVQMMLVALGILLWILYLPDTAQALSWQDWWHQGLWWQQEIPPPGKNQIINPEYLTKKQALDESWNQLNRQNNMSRQYQRWTTRYHGGGYWSDRRSLNKTVSLERELAKIPMYVEQGAPPDPGPEAAEGLILKY